MPTYRYACASCANEFDQYQSYAEDALTDCPSCDGAIRRVIQPVGVVFKGSGWYLTDSRKPDKSAETTSDGQADGKSDGKDKTAAATDGKADAGKAEASTKSEPAPKKAEPARSSKSVESRAATTASS